SCSRRAIPVPPPVSTSLATRRACWAPTSRTASRAAAAAASSSGSRCTMTWAPLTTAVPRRSRATARGGATAGDVGDTGQRGGIDLIGVEASELLGQAVGDGPPGQGHPPFGLPGLGQRADLRVRADQLDGPAGAVEPNRVHPSAGALLGPLDRDVEATREPPGEQVGRGRVGLAVDHGGGDVLVRWL